MPLIANVREDVSEMFASFSGGTKTPNNTFNLRNEEVSCNRIEKRKNERERDEIPPTLPCKKGTSVYYH